ncbi:MAG: amphi-Trp domain-containing protein [Sporichthyaceae bacterium]
MTEREVERSYTVGEFTAKLRRLADALDAGEAFRIQVAGERFTVPRDAQISVEHERGEDEVEIEFQLKWKITEVTDAPCGDDEV